MEELRHLLEVYMLYRNEYFKGRLPRVFADGMRTCFWVHFYEEVRDY